MFGTITRFRVVWVVFLAWVYWGLSPHVSQGICAAAESQDAEGAEIVRGVVKLWQTRRNQVQTLRYEAKGRLTVPKGTFDGDSGLAKEKNGVALEQDYVHDWSVRWLIDLAGNRFRIEINWESFHVSEAKFNPVHNLYVFNGQDLRCHHIAVREHRGTHYSIAQPEFRYYEPDHPILTTMMVPVFRAHGAVFGGQEMRDVPHIGDPISAESLLYHREAKLYGRPCVVLRIRHQRGGFREFYVDLQRKGLVVREARFGTTPRSRFDGRPGVYEHLRNRYDLAYEHTDRGWMPKSWIYTEIDARTGKPRRILKAEVTERELNPQIAADQFKLNPQPGMLVNDSRIRRAYQFDSETPSRIAELLAEREREGKQTGHTARSDANRDTPAEETAPDLKKRLATVLADARADNTRVLLVFGNDETDSARKLIELMEKNDHMIRLLKSEYEVLPVDVPDSQIGRQLARQHGVDLAATELPCLVVLSSDGGVIKKQDRAELRTDADYDPQRLVALLKKLAVPPLDAEELLQAALGQAEKEEKRVFIHLGAPWCGPCHRLERFLRDQQQILRPDYVFLKIDIDRMTNGKSVADRLRESQPGGIPWMAILDDSGKKLITSDGPKGNIGHPVGPEEIEHFIAMLRSTGKRISAKQLAEIREKLAENAKEVGIR